MEKILELIKTTDFTKTKEELKEKKARFEKELAKIDSQLTAITALETIQNG